MVTFNEAVKAGKVTLEEAEQLFDSLPAVKPEELRGLWKGESFATGSPLDGGLEKSGWYGKEFIDNDKVHPLVFKSNSNGRFNVNPVKILHLQNDVYLPDVQSDVETDQPTARIRVVEYRGVPTASMVYNERPIIDSFRKVDENTVLGSMENPELPVPYFFVLRRET
ncbi:hypothetical protein FNYG_06847 [Fusarium nygamai]|uniref:GXWXG domain-containing protein n=1 Tax=Gibberella nygamai TaxID=42673 RepID=A0A2K0WBU4_GIBNY|nr:hypothetical protein FNYG_06847 [Fusarium nygamai]